MVIMRIHCGTCGGAWDVYNTQRDSAASRLCPHCDSKLNEHTWEHSVLPAFEAAKMANLSLSIDEADRKASEFQIDFIADGKYQNAEKADIMNEIYDMQATLSDIEESLKNNNKV